MATKQLTKIKITPTGMRLVPGWTQMEAHSGRLLAGTPAAAALVASEKTLYVT